MGYEHSTKKRTDCGARGLAGANNRVGAAALEFGKIARNDFAVGGIGDGLADAENEAHGKQQFEPADEAGSKCGGRPQQNSKREDPVDRETVDQPPGDDLEDGVSPEEGGEEDSELGIGKTELVFDVRSGDGEIPAVDVVDEDGEGEEDGQAGKLRREPGSSNSGGQYVGGRAHCEGVSSVCSARRAAAMPSESRVRSPVLRPKKKSASAARPITKMRKPKASLTICARRSGIERVREGTKSNRGASGMPESLYAVGCASANESGKPAGAEAENQRSVRSPAPTWACNLYFPLPFFSKERNKPPWDSPKGAASMPPDMTEASTWL